MRSAVLLSLAFVSVDTEEVYQIYEEKHELNCRYNAKLTNTVFEKTNLTCKMCVSVGCKCLLVFHSLF